MKLEIIAKRLEKENVNVYILYNPQSGGCKFSLKEIYANKEGKEKIEYVKYIPEGLYMSRYKIIATELTGIYHSENKSYAVRTDKDDYYGDTIAIFNVNDYSLNREDVYNEFFSKNETSFIIEDVYNKTYYTANTFFDGNTIENITLFINTMNENGQEFKIVKYGKQYIKEENK